MKFASAVVVSVLAGACSVPRPTFECLEDDWSRCGPGGACEPGTGSCSFPDVSCTSGRRFSEIARSQYADECVPLETAPGRSQLCTTTASCIDGRHCLAGRCLSIESFTGTEDFFCATCTNHAGGRSTSTAAVCWGPSIVVLPQNPTVLNTNRFDCGATTPTNCPPECATCTTDCPSYCVNIYALDSIVVGGSHLCFDDGRTQCLGTNREHQTGFDTAGDFGAFQTPERYDRLAASTHHTCARPANAPGVVDCWGSRTTGQLGIMETPQPGSQPQPVRSTPFPPNPNIAVVEKMALGAAFTCAASNDNRLTCWGATPGAQGVVPLPAGDLRALDAGRDHACVLVADRVLCWGANQLGQSVPGNPAPRIATPLEALPGVAVVAIATGRDHSCAVTAAGAIQCWGSFDRGQLGGGNPGPGPAIVSLDPPAAGPINAGANVTCALHVDDRVRCWGDVFAFDSVVYDDFEVCTR